MNKKDVKIGMKVVPFQKTIWGGLENSPCWKRAKELNQQYLYVINWDKGEECWTLSDECNTNDRGDFFNSCDFESYIENKNEIRKVKEIKGKLIRERNNEEYGRIGDKTPLKDIDNKQLYVGDIVSFSSEYNTDYTIVCTQQGDIMGIFGCDQNTINICGVKKIKSYTELKDGEVIRGVVKVVLDKEIKNEIKPINKPTIKVHNIKHIINGTTTIVTLEDGSKGVARLHPNDEFDEQEGFIWAYARACGMESEYVKTLQEYTNEELIAELKNRMK